MLLEDQITDGSAVLSLVQSCLATCSSKLYRSADDESTLGTRSDLPQAITHLAATGDGSLYGWGGKGGHLWRSRDHGHTWEQTSVTQVTDVLPRPGSVWATTVSCHPGCRQVLVGGSEDPSTLRPLYSARSSFAVVRASATTAYGLRSLTDGTDFLTTRDGGRSWSSRPWDCELVRWCSLSAVGSSTVWAVSGREPGTGEQPKSARVSTDGARHWSAVEHISDAGYATNVLAVSSRVAYVAGGRSALLGTVDSGRTWRTLTPEEEGFTNIIRLADGTLLAPDDDEGSLTLTLTLISVWRRSALTGRWSDRLLEPGA